MRDGVRGEGLDGGLDGSGGGGGGRRWTGSGEARDGFVFTGRTGAELDGLDASSGGIYLFEHKVLHWKSGCGVGSAVNPVR